MCVVAGIMFVGCTVWASVTLTWGTGTNYVYDISGANLLAPAEMAYTGSGCFVQLIKANAEIHPAVPSGNGVSGGDEVVGTSWIGEGFITSLEGRFSSLFVHDLALGVKIYIRAWNAASPDYDGSETNTTASVPTGADVRYGDSLLYATTSDPGSEPPPSEFFTLDNAGGSIATVLGSNAYYSVIVGSAQGTASPSAGTNIYIGGSTETCVVAGSPVDAGTTQYICTGWTGTGSAPSAGTTTNTGSFTITNDSSVTWNWKTQYWLDTTAGANGSVDITDVSREKTFFDRKINL